MMSTVRDRIGPYEVLGPVGAGGMGEVYVARDPKLGRRVALKVLPVRLADDPDTLVRFTQEARSASALNHPNIVTIHEVGMHAGRPYIVMELVDGRDLRSFIREGPLPVQKTLDVAAQIADGLAAAHERGIVHRDLKPENIMVTKDGFVKILDFGLAKMTQPATEDEVTAQLNLPGTNPGTILGTVGYMSPEQASGRKLDFRSDQFAFGAILYELATARAAFDGDNAIDTLSAILHDQPEPIDRFNEQVPEPFCGIVERLLEKEPAARFASTRDVARELRALRDRAAVESNANGEWASSTLTRRRARARSRRRIAGIASAAIAAVILLTIGWSLRRAAAAPKDTKKYVAVMRFKDLTGDPHGQVVVDGLAETLSARLAHFPTVQVMHPTSDALVSSNVVGVARDLGANVALTGSMQRSGDQIRVSYRVIDVANGSEEGGDLIDGSASDLFSVEDRLAIAVANTLRLGAPTFKVAPPDNTVSHRLFLEALGNLRRYDSEPSVDAAIRILEDLGSKSNSASVQAQLGRAYLAKFQLTHDPKWAVPATAACERAVAADPQNPEVHVTLGELRRQTGRLADARNEFNAALAQEPNNADAVLGLADTYKAEGDVAKAEAEYKRAIDLQPNFWGGYNRLGAFYATHARYDDAARMFAKVVQLVPDNQRGYNNLGGVYEQMGRYEDAIKVFQQSIAKRPTDQAYSNLGTCFYYLGRYADAAAAYESAIKLTPRQYMYWANLGDAQRWVPGSDTRAAEAYDRAIKLTQDELNLNPSDASVRARLAECLAKRGRFSEANQEISRALTEDPSNVGVLYRAAVVANASGNMPKTAQCLNRAIAAGYSRADIQRDPEFALFRSRTALQ